MPRSERWTLGMNTSVPTSSSVNASAAYPSPLGASRYTTAARRQLAAGAGADTGAPAGMPVGATGSAEPVGSGVLLTTAVGSGVSSGSGVSLATGVDVGLRTAVADGEGVADTTSVAV